MPAVVLQNPKYAHNVGAVLRSCSCYGIPQLIFTGTRVPMPGDAGGKKGVRLPREERMKGYRDVELINTDYPFDRFPLDGVQIVGVEILPAAAPLTWFEHADDAIYVFGPEDGSISKSFCGLCHQILYIPARHCLNLAVAVSTVLYDRQYKAHANGIGHPSPPGDATNEDRGISRDFG